MPNVAGNVLEADLIFSDSELEQGFLTRAGGREREETDDFIRNLIGSKRYDEIHAPRETETSKDKKSEEKPLSAKETVADMFISSPQTQIAGGVRDAVANTLNIVTDIRDLFMDKKGAPISSFIPEIPADDSVANNILRSGAQFMTDFAPIMGGLGKVKAFGKAGKIGKILQTEIAGALAGAAAFDPEDPRLSNLINDLVPALKNPVTEFLATEAGDTAAEGRFKNALEGLGLGALAEGIFGAFRGIRAAKGLGKASEVSLVSTESQEFKSFKGLSDIELQKELVKAQDAVNKAIKRYGFGGISEKEQHPLLVKAVKEKQRISNEVFNAKRLNAPVGSIVEYKGEQMIVEKVTFDTSQSLDALYKGFRGGIDFKETIHLKSIKGENATQIRFDEFDKLKIIKKGEISTKEKSKFIKTDEAGNTVINTDAINTSDDLRKAIASLGTLSKKRQQAKRGVRSKETTQAAADILDTKIEDILKFSEGTVKNAEEIIDVARVVDQEHGKIIDLATQYLKSTDEAEKFVIGNELLKEIDVFTLIDPKFFGIRGESGRALEAQKLIQDTVGRLLRISENVTLADENTTVSQLAEMLLSEQMRPKKMFSFLRLIKKVPNMIVEMWMSGLLSSIRTHEVNILGNLSTTLFAIPERFTASMIPGRGVQSQEALDMIFGIVNSFRQGISIAGRTLRTGVPASQATKLEGRAFKAAISAEELGLTGTAGRAADLLGEFVRLPFRGLSATDDFFRHINSQAELYALARRTAREQGLSGKAEAEKMYEIINDPPAHLAKQAENFAAYQTFTNELGDIGKSVVNLANAHPTMRFVLPFVRTPVNIFKYTLERIPFLAGILKKTRNDIRAGGAKRDLAIARQALGGMALMTFGMYARAGYFTGSGPKNKNLKHQMMETGWRPYSIKTGDKYISYNRLDPIGMMIGIVSDINDLYNSGQLDFSEMEELVLAVSVAFSRNMTSKTYMTGMRNALEIITLGSGENIGSGTHAIKKFTGSFVPTILRDIEKAQDPYLREIDTFWKSFKSNVPYFSKEVPLIRNLFGEPIQLQGSPIMHLANPLYVSIKKKDEVMDEIIENEVIAGAVPSYIFGQRPSAFGVPDPDDGIKLTEEQHDRYKVLAGEGLRESMEKAINSVQYNSLTKGAFGMRHKLLTSILQKHREIAKKKMLREFPELQDQIEDRQRILNELKLIGE